ncbi:MAG: hypothetical protein HQM06_10650 [Magnetococcales bacterium]|nr:hypothetical protein [Magnetococcales bacterium]
MKPETAPSSDQALDELSVQKQAIASKEALIFIVWRFKLVFINNKALSAYGVVPIHCQSSPLWIAKATIKSCAKTNQSNTNKTESGNECLLSPPVRPAQDKFNINALAMTVRANIIFCHISRIST